MRLQELRKLLASEELDALLVSTPENRRYLSGFTGSAGHLLITPHEAVLATDFRYVEQASRQAPSWQVKQVSSDQSWFTQLVSEFNLERIGFESDFVTVASYQRLVQTLTETTPETKASLIATDGLVDRLRTTKDADEIALMQRAAEIADKALAEVAPTIQPGQTEKAVAWELEKRMREAGAEAVSFEVIVAAGPNGAMPHHRPSERPIESGEPIVIDMGAKYKGYCSDLTRTVFAGEPGPLFKKVYDIVLGAQLTAMSLIRPGMTGEEADSFARGLIKEAGYGDAFGHSLGHGVGLAVHETPRLGPGSTQVLEEGMVFSVEPGIYLPDKGGVRIEDMVVLEKDGVRSLSHAPKAL